MQSRILYSTNFCWSVSYIFSILECLSLPFISFPEPNNACDTDSRENDSNSAFFIDGASLMNLSLIRLKASRTCLPGMFADDDLKNPDSRRRDASSFVLPMSKGILYLWKRFLLDRQKPRWLQKSDTTCCCGLLISYPYSHSKRDIYESLIRTCSGVGKILFLLFWIFIKL